jgi:cytochrome c oxidase subunit 1
MNALPVRHYLNQKQGIASWLLTTDHKRIALLYLISVTFYFLVGSFFALLIRLELLTPQGDMVQPDTYNKLFTMHGVVMVFFFLIPAIPTVLGNFLIPMMIGARDLAFPRINLMSWYVFNLGALFTLYAVFKGGVDTGWTFYPPYSSLYANTHVIAAAVGIFITGFSSIMTGLNFIITVHTMPSSASWSGGTTCSPPGSRRTRRWSSRCSATWSPSPRRSRSSAGPPPSTRARCPWTPPCSTPSASSGSS